jgi:hypothetical protein
MSRLWYPQLDVFDTVRRMCIALQHFTSAPGIERLYIVDFFLANPPLLYRTTMTQDIRKKFMELSIKKPDKTFVSYPSSFLLFHKMELIQKEALTALSGKGLISIDRLKKGYLEMTDKGKELFVLNDICTESEAKLCVFLTVDFAKNEEAGNFELRRRTGLRRTV